MIIAVNCQSETKYTVNIAPKGLIGHYLTDEDGYALYISANDTPHESNCVESCSGNWPPFHVAKLVVPPNLSSSDFGAIIRADGTKQTTFKGMPLYRLIEDAKPYETAGDGAEGGLWSVARPVGNIRIANNTTLGPYLTDADGRTLYYFLNDSGKGNSTCRSNETINCPEIWPQFNAIIIDAGFVPSNLNASDFRIFIRGFNGERQTSYKGWPLYYYSGDLEPGDMNGQGLFGLWYAVTLNNFQVK
jgi:predicted lipoprotein with Yx(FWY)xxD motif